VIGPERLIPINGVALVVNATRRMVAALIFGLRKDDDAALHARAVSAAGAAAAAAAEVGPGRYCSARPPLL